MTENTLLILAISLVGVFFGLLMAVLGWIGNKVYNKVDEISKNLVTMAGELHERINGIDSRLIRVEAVEAMCNGNPTRRKTDRGNT